MAEEKEEKLVLDTHEIIYRHYLQDGTERIQLEDPLIFKYSSVMGDMEFPIYAVNEMLHRLHNAVLERINNG